MLANPDLESVGRHVQVGLTPVIIADEIEWSDAAARRGRARGARRRVRAAGAPTGKAATPSATSRHYSSALRRRRARTSPRGRAHKRKVNGAKRWIKVGVSRVAMFRYPRERDFVVVTFDQDYRSSGLSNVMRKRQYWVKEGAAAGKSSTREQDELQTPLHPFGRRGRLRGALAADPQVDVKTSAGTIRLELYPAKAPKTVENFLQYVRDGHYNGTMFHRVIDGFMIQGGGIDGEHASRSRPASRS